ncbi:MAG: sigma 54-interacting transcriptional regulator [Acidobacteriota bacterium]
MPESAAPPSALSDAGIEAQIALAGRLVDACAQPALLVAEGGGLARANRTALDLLGLERSTRGAGTPVRELLGVGWRELTVIARAGDAGLVADLPAAPGAPRRGAKVRIEPVAARDGAPRAVVAFLDVGDGRERSGPMRRESPRAPGFDAIFGHDPELLAAKDAGARFARTLLPVLLLAETGTGKELMARALHHESPRRDQPFVAINCGALSPHLLESELFGYAPGAFTGASREGHEGKVGAARGGTLFLDEVAEMPGPLQALLLRVLEDGTYYRVGESRPRQADVRLICATCRDLPGLVRDGGFRQDLFYRINGACLSLPPVRQRTDVAELALHLLDQLSGRRDLLGDRERPPALSARALEWMIANPWPGNVRELKTALQHALILCDGDEIGIEHLPARLDGLLARDGERDPAPSIAEPSTSGSSTSGSSTSEASSAVPSPERASTKRTSSESRPAPPAAPKTLAEREAERLVAAVEAAEGNLSRAAGDLGIARSTLYRRLRKHGLLE